MASLFGILMLKEEALSVPFEGMPERGRAPFTKALAAHVNDKQSVLGRCQLRDIDTIITIPRIDLRDVQECVERDLLDVEVASRLVAGSSVSYPRRYCRTSTSSGYSSHSPPLSAAASYSCCPTSGAYLSQDVIVHGLTPPSTKSHLTPTLTVIHETDTIPRPIWPCVSFLDSACYECYRHHYDLERAENIYDYSCSICCTCACSVQPSRYPCSIKKPDRLSRRILLKRLSRRLNTILENDNALSTDEILQDIAKTLAAEEIVDEQRKKGQKLGEDSNRNCECNGCRNAPLSSTSSLSPSSSSDSGGENSSPLTKMIRSNINISTRGHLCVMGCRQNDDKQEQKLLMRQIRRPASSRSETFFSTSEDWGCCNTTNKEVKRKSKTNLCFAHPARCRDANNENVLERMFGIEESVGIGSFTQLLTHRQELADKAAATQGRKSYAYMEHKYLTLENNSDESSYSSERIVNSSSKQDWYIVGGFNKNLDFTLDASKAERLGRTIARAKRKRQWCRAITAILGLVVFVLSVVVVSLSVTRGRKVFGSM